MERTIFKAVKEASGMSSYKLAKSLDISQSELRYQENQSESIQKKVLKRLFEIAKEHGIDAEECIKRL